MKKRLFSLLLSLCLVAGLFAGLASTAYADGESQTQTYTVELGDSLSKICDKLKVNYNANKEWIQKTNKLANPNLLTVGQVLTLPAAGLVLKWVEPAASTTTPATTTTGTTTAATTVPATTTSYNYGVPTVQYTMKNGDYVLKICKDLGIDFAKNEAWIKAANGITNYNNLKVGRVLILPAPGTTPAISTATASGTTGTTTATTLPATTTTTTATGLLAGDTVSYYLISYTVRSGDTLFNICNSLGANMDTVQKLNNITNAARLTIGQVLSIPSSVVPTSGSYVRVVSHKVVSGDTVMGICQSYGVDYGKNAAQIKALNNRDNLDAIKVGQTILIPVNGSAVVPGSGGSSAIPINGGGASGNQTYYALNKTGAVNGTYALTVNGQAVNGAAAGQTVHVVVTPDHGYKLGSVSVVRAYNGAKVDVDVNNNFLMPACNVNITVTFTVDDTAQPHQILKSSVSAGVTLTYVVNGYTNSVAEKGQVVRIVPSTLPSGQVIDKVYVTTVQPTLEQLQKGTLDASKYVAVAADLSFAMPACVVYVTVLLKGA